MGSPGLNFLSNIIEMIYLYIHINVIHFSHIRFLLAIPDLYLFIHTYTCVYIKSTVSSQIFHYNNHDWQYL